MFKVMNSRTSFQFRLRVAVLIAGGLFLAVSTAYAASSPVPVTRLNEAQAVQIARAFCAKIGEPVSVPATVISPEKNEDAAHSSWLPCWHVAFSGQAKLDVVDVNGAIADYDNEGYFRQHDNPPLGEAISQQEAIQRGKDALRATGQVEPTEFGYAQLMQTRVQPIARRDRFWRLYWSRTSRGIPYRDQHFIMDLDAETGEVIGMSQMYPTAPLASAVKAVGQEDAISAAASQVINEGIEETATHSGTKLEIISPVFDWNNLHGRSGPSDSVRLAWVSTFVVDGHWRQVEIDTETGEILGEGRDNGPAGRQGAVSVKAIPPPIGTMLRSVRAVSVRRPDAGAKGTTRPFLKFSAKTQPHALAVLAQTADFRKDGPSGAAPAQVVLVSRSHSLGVYSYFPATGLLGSGADWARVPEEFKSWMQGKMAAAGAAGQAAGK